jgi:hypothetical protein
MDSGSSSQRIHFQTGVVSHGQETGCLGHRTGFFNCVRFARVAVFDDFGYVRKFVHGPDTDGQVGQECGKFLSLMPITGGEHQFVDHQG